MDETQWSRLTKINHVYQTEVSTTNLVNPLKCRETFIKFKATGRTYARIYYLTFSEHAIHYQGSKHQLKREVCQIKDIDEIRPGLDTIVWRECLKKGTVTSKQEHLAFSILYHNNRRSIDLLADSEAIRNRWTQGLNYLLERYRSHLQTHHQITDQWISFLFNHVDLNQTGRLNRQEIRHLLFNLNIKLNEREIDYYFNQANIRINNFEQLENLDREEFLLFYKFVSHRPELVKIMCQFNGNTMEQNEVILSEYNVIHQLACKNPIGEPRLNDEIKFRRRNGAVTGTADIDNRKNYLTVPQLQEFLREEQEMKDVSIDDSEKLIARFEPSFEGQKDQEIGVDGLRLLLLHDEFCLMDPSKSHRVYHDMNRPITDYFIATSHNTYIQNNQLFGDCTPETFIHALRIGCRAVELDCYNGDQIEPMVYHALTPTKPIPFRAIIHAIKPQAFANSPYPLFLNLENHCSYEQQGVMARILRETFEDHLLTKALKEDFEHLPSPEELKYKVIIRSRRHPKGKIPADIESDRSNDDNELHPKDYHPDFASLIIYSQIVSFTNIEHTLSAQKSFHSISLKESKANDLIKRKPPGHLDLLKLTRNHLVRIYPGAKRQDSSNIHPVPFWTYGIQMVALNYQSNDESMCLQHGFFSDNGGCGYLLKPACLLTEDFNPKKKYSDRNKYITIRVISAQHLPKEKHQLEHKDIVDPYVEISTKGVLSDCTEHRTPSVRDNGLNPIWDHKITLTIHCIELCLIKFEVRDHDRHGPSSFLGHACFPLNAIQCGYRHIKLRGKNEDFIHGTLFVHVKMTDA